MVTPREIGHESGDQRQNPIPNGAGVDPLAINRTAVLPDSEMDAARSPNRGAGQEKQETNQRREPERQEPSFLGSLWDAATGFIDGALDFGKNLIEKFRSGEALNAVLGFIYNVGEFLGVNGFLRFGYNLVMGCWYKAIGNEEKAKEHFSKLTVEDALDFALGLIAICTFGAGLAARGAVKGATMGMKAIGNHISKEVFEDVAKKITREGVEKVVEKAEKEAAQAAVKEIEKAALKNGALPGPEVLNRIFTKALKPVMDKIDKKILKAIDEDAIRAMDKALEGVLQAGKKSDIYKILRASAKNDAEAEWMLQGLKRVIKGDFKGIHKHYGKLGDKAIKNALTDPKNPESLLSLLRNHLLQNGAGETFEKTLREGLQNSSVLKEIALKQGKNFDEWVEGAVKQGKQKYADELDNILKKRIERWVDEALKRIRRRRHRPHLGNKDDEAEKAKEQVASGSKHKDEGGTRTSVPQTPYEAPTESGKRVQRQVTTSGTGSGGAQKSGQGPKSSIFVQNGNIHGIKMEGDLADSSVFANKGGEARTANQGLPHELAESLGTKAPETRTVGGVIDMSEEVIKSSKPSTTTTNSTTVDIGNVLANAAGKDKAA